MRADVVAGIDHAMCVIVPQRPQRKLILPKLRKVSLMPPDQGSLFHSGYSGMNDFAMPYLPLTPVRGTQNTDFMKRHAGQCAEQEHNDDRATLMLRQARAQFLLTARILVQDCWHFEQHRMPSLLGDLQGRCKVQSQSGTGGVPKHHQVAHSSCCIRLEAAERPVDGLHQPNGSCLDRCLRPATCDPSSS